HYIRTAEGRLGKLAPTTSYKVQGAPVREIEINKEGELEAMAEEAQKVLLNTSSYLDSVEKEGKLTEFQLLGPRSSLKMAKEAYENDRFTEAIRLANKARFQIDELVNKKKPGIILGKAADYPVTLNLTDADLSQTLKLIYDLTGANIVLMQGISGRVSINVKDLPLQRVLDLICESNNLKYVEDNGVIKIMTADEFNRSAAAVKARLRRVFQVHYGDAYSIMKALKETFPTQTIVHEPRTNSIVVEASDEDAAMKIGEVVSSLDTPISQVLIEAKLVEIVISDENTFGIDWLVSSRLVEALGSGGTLTGPRFGDNPNFTPGSSATLPQGTFAFGITNYNVNMLIQALSAKGKVKLLQAPKIMCLNGTTAVISVEQNVPYLIPQATVSQQQQTITTSSTFNVFEDQVGTEFMVTPVIQRNRSIFLNLNIYDARLIEIRKLTATAGGQTYSTEQPVISSRETNQSIVVYDGQTLIIGGMIQDRQDVRTTGVPFLQHIPLLGNLFKKQSYSNSKSEMLLFLTPRVVSSYEDANFLSKPDVQKLEKKIDGGILEKF
ncbi:MAG: secretin and TonB N-terminal domain-containing protein, partial [Candidatus Omnitrophica bacterium]|nr:secretin and TonB N-terminal domain-containing protein [Candidatus Omnitrophota bacterium]